MGLNVLALRVLWAEYWRKRVESGEGKDGRDGTGRTGHVVIEELRVTGGRELCARLRSHFRHRFDANTGDRELNLPDGCAGRTKRVRAARRLDETHRQANRTLHCHVHLCEVLCARIIGSIIECECSIIGFGFGCHRQRALPMLIRAEHSKQRTNTWSNTAAQCGALLYGVRVYRWRAQIRRPRVAKIGAKRRVRSWLKVSIGKLWKKSIQ